MTWKGNKKLSYYRFNWKPRNTDRTANDYTPVFDMIDAANVTGPVYEPNLAGVIDMDNWMRTFAMNDLASFWDSFGNPNSKNAYVYKPQRSGWKIMSWDFDVGLGVFNDPPDYPLFAGGVDPVIVRMYNTPSFVRNHWAALQEALDNFFDAASVTPFLQARYDAFQANAISSTSPFVPSGPYNLSVPNWITTRRNFLINQLTTVASAFVVDGPDQVSSSENLWVLTGAAPVGVSVVTVNGQSYPITWETVNDWSLQVPLAPGLNVLNIQGLDRLGQPVAGASRTVTADYTGSGALPEQHVVINEIMYDPMISDAEFVEIHNTSTPLSFDLSGWRLNGIDYDFRPGAIITNGQFMILVKNRRAFASVHGPEIPVYDEYDGNLDNGGETLTLFRPGPGEGVELVVDRVTYDDDLPWPATDGQDLALQLIDPQQDNSRVGNWKAEVQDDGWKEFSLTQALAGSASSVLFNLEQAGVVYVDDIELVLGSEPGAGPNLLVNGDLESGSLSPWVALGNHDGSVASTDTTFSGNYSMKIVATGPGTSLNLVRQSVGGLISGNTYTFSFKYYSAEPNRLRWRINTFFSDFVEGLDVTPIPPIRSTRPPSTLLPIHCLPLTRYG